MTEEKTTDAGGRPFERPVRRLPDFRVRLICWHCGSSKEVLTHGPAHFAFEIVGWAQDVGMVGFFDMRYGRALIFCNADHARQQMTKSGTFRLRPKRDT